jgi:GNAT superfamily N-acetyltransferase
MIGDRLTPATRIPDDLRIGAPEDDAECAAILDINSRAYGMDLGACQPLYGTRAFWADHVGVLGRTDGTAATCAAVLMVDGYRYVALVATDPAYQRRGFAEAAMRCALDAARGAHGDRPTFLHATEAGRPIYARMGYEPVANHTAFMEKRFLTDH